MIFAGLELLGDIPFSDVIIHSTVLAPDGRRMSKSLGTGIDPLDVIEQHGTDATRYGLLKMSSTQDVRFSTRRSRRAARLANKLWNASRLLLRTGATWSSCGRRRSRSAGSSRASTRRARRSRPTSRAYDFSHAVDRLYHLTFDDFCDWYLESIKPRLGERATCRRRRSPRSSGC